MNALLSASYLLGHVAAGATYVTVIVTVPLAAMFAAAILGNDPGGPLFWPAFLLMLVAFGITSAAALSLLTATTDFVRLRWRISVWVPPVFIAVAASVSAAWMDHLHMPAGYYVVAGFGAGIAFSLYWAAVSFVWCLPRSLARFAAILKTCSDGSLRRSVFRQPRHLARVTRTHS